MIKAIVCDIEGTTTSIEFAHKVLFPISYQRIETFVQENLELVKEEIKSVQQATGAESLNDVIATLKRWIEQDRKEGALKSIQGKIWKEAFDSGQIKGHVYPDVAIQFEKWHKAGIRIAIFSSGSVEAQQLIFRFSQAGDLTPYISDYFDTKIGAKKEPLSYQRIAEKLQLLSPTILFSSDVIAELDAAAESGMKTVLLLRDDARAPDLNHHHVAADFYQIELKN